MGSIILVPILLLLLINSTATTDSIASANSTATTTITTTQNPTTDSTASTDSTISTDTTITANPTPTTPTTATTVSTISTAIPITADTTPTTPTTATTDSTISTATTIVAAPTTTAPPTTTTDSTISTATTIAAAPTSTVPPTTTADSTISTATTITADPTPTTPTTATTVSTISTATPITADTTPTTPTTATTGSTISTATTITIDATATTESTPPTSSADSTTDSTITPTTTPNMTPKPTTPRPTLPPGKEAPNFAQIMCEGKFGRPPTFCFHPKNNNDGKYMNVSSSMKWKNGWHADLDKKESQIYRETKTDIEDQINIISKDAKGFKQSEVFGFKQCSTYTMFLTQEAGYTTDAFVAEFKLSYGLRDCVENPAEVSDNMTSTLAGLCTINITVDGKDGTVDQAYFNKTTSAPIKSAADDVKNDTIRADMVCGNNVCPRTSDCTLVGTLVDCHDKCAAKGEVDPQCIKDFENFPGSEDLAVCYLSEDDEGNYKPYCGCKPTAYNTGKYCLNMWWIIGPTVGGAVLLILIFTIVIIVVSRKRKSPQPTPDTLFADGMPME